MQAILQGRTSRLQHGPEKLAGKIEFGRRLASGQNRQAAGWTCFGLHDALMH
jgi:hypothetical protein